MAGQPRFEPRAEDDLAALEVAADVRDVGGHLAAADLQRGAVEADVGDVVLAAAVRAAAHLDVDPLGQLVGDLHRLDPLLDRPVEAHRGGDPEFAAVGAGAADHVGDLARRRPRRGRARRAAARRRRGTRRGPSAGRSSAGRCCGRSRR